MPSSNSNSSSNTTSKITHHPTSSPRSTGTILRGIVAFTAFLALALVINLTVLAGCVLYPRTVLGVVVLPYVIYILSIANHDAHDGAPWDAFRRDNWIFRAARQYLNLRLIFDQSLTHADAQPHAKFILAVFPHGSNADYRILMDGLLAEPFPNTFSKLRTLAATVLFRIPVVRELSLWTSCVQASRSVAHRLLQRGRSLLVLPGGQAEQLRTVYGRERVYLRRRKGFIKLAMQHGVPVVPVYVFGCSDYYQTSNLFLSLRLALLKYTGIALPMAFGWKGHLLCPKPVDTTVVLGKPLQFAFVDNKNHNEGNKVLLPSESEQIDDAHEQFCQALTELFDQHKEALGYGDRQLEIL